MTSNYFTKNLLPFYPQILSLDYNTGIIEFKIKENEKGKLDIREF